MEVRLTDDQAAFVRQGIERGDYRDSSDALRDALSLWEERERARTEIRLALEESELDIAEGRYRDYAPGELSSLAEEINTEARTNNGS